MLTGAAPALPGSQARGVRLPCGGIKRVGGGTYPPGMPPLPSWQALQEGSRAHPPPSSRVHPAGQLSPDLPPRCPPPRAGASKALTAEQSAGLQQQQQAGAGRGRGGAGHAGTCSPVQPGCWASGGARDCKSQRDPGGGGGEECKSQHAPRGRSKGGCKCPHGRGWGWGIEGWSALPRFLSPFAGLLVLPSSRSWALSPMTPGAGA